MEDGPARLLEAARSLGSTLDPSRLLVVVCEEATRVAGADYADVFLGSPDRGLRVEATYGRPGTAIGARLESGEGIAGKAVERGETVAGTRTLAVPLSWGGELRGAIAVEYGGKRERTLAEEALLERLADLAGTAYRNAVEHAELALAARVDSLTGCLNHAAMHETLRRELERSRRSGQPLSVVIADLDDFKQVNEAHGHLMGDEVLQRVGTALRETVRAYDVVARYGGDEFVVLAIDADEATAAEVAGRGVEGIGRALATLPLGGTRTAATAGVAQWDGDESPTMLIARADTALLYGKRHGKRGLAVTASAVPAGFRPDRSGRR